MKSLFDLGANLMVMQAWRFPLLDYSYLRRYVLYFSGDGNSFADWKTVWLAEENGSFGSRNLSQNKILPILKLYSVPE